MLGNTLQPSGGERTLARGASDMACGFVRGHHILCVVDKQGDIYCANALKLNSWVLMGGHTASVITDMQIIHEGSLWPPVTGTKKYALASSLNYIKSKDTVWVILVWFLPM